VAEKEEGNRISQSYRLLEAYWEDSPPDMPFHRSNFDHEIGECGYQREQLFDADDLGGPRDWSPYRTYFDLLMLRQREAGEAVEDLRANFLQAHTSAFSSEFLRICLRQSLLASICARRVRAILANGGWRDDYRLPPGQQIDMSVYDRHICAYLYGIAAHRGLPVATPRQ